MTRLRMSASLVLAGVLAVAGCSDDSGGPDAGPKVDQKVYPDLQPLDFGGGCGEGIYPCGPYGTTKGTVAADESFLGFADTDNFCKEHKDKTLDSSKAVNFRFADWYKKPDGCRKTYKLVWINVAAGWCGPCRAEVAEIKKEFNNGTFPAEVDFLNIVFEDSNRKPVSQAFLKTWADTQKLPFPVVMDPSFKMGQYFDKAATPFNMLVNTETMEIVYETVGANIPKIMGEINAFLAK